MVSTIRDCHQFTHENDACLLYCIFNIVEIFREFFVEDHIDFASVSVRVEDNVEVAIVSASRDGDLQWTKCKDCSELVKGIDAERLPLRLDDHQIMPNALGKGNCRRRRVYGSVEEAGVSTETQGMNTDLPE